MLMFEEFPDLRIIILPAQLRRPILDIRGQRTCRKYIVLHVKDVGRRARPPGLLCPGNDSSPDGIPLDIPDGSKKMPPVHGIRYEPPLP